MRRINWFRFALFATALVLALSLNFPAAGKHSAHHQIDSTTVYLPLVMNQICGGTGPGVFGLVTEDGLPARDASIFLIVDNYRDPGKVLGPVVTNATGCYAFTDSTDLELLIHAAGYYAMFKNTTNHPGRLASYVDCCQSHYEQGTQIHMPTIEIGEVALLSPQDQTVLAYPVTFRWLPRGDTTRYRVRITGRDYYFDTSPSTYPESYTLESGNGFTPGVWYTWKIVVESSTGIGESRETRQIAFKTSLFLPVLLSRD